jgi:hypothetical protein
VNIFLTLLLLLCLAHPAVAQKAGTTVENEAASASESVINDDPITISQTQDLIPAAFGIMPQAGLAGTYSWKGSSPEQLVWLIEQLETPFGSGALRTLSVRLLQAPVLPNEAANVPDDWLMRRLNALERLGEYEAAWELYSEIPELLIKEALARKGVHIALLNSNVSGACRIVRSIMLKQNITFPSDEARIFWLSHLILCQQIEGEYDKASLTLGLLEESAPETVPPFLQELINGWGTEETLPPLTKQDILLLPALSALITPGEATYEPVVQRLSATTFDTISLDEMPLPLLRGLYNTDLFSPEARCYMAELGLSYNIATPEILATCYEMLATVEKTVLWWSAMPAPPVPCRHR